VKIGDLVREKQTGFLAIVLSNYIEQDEYLFLDVAWLAKHYLYERIPIAYLEKIE